MIGTGWRGPLGTCGLVVDQLAPFLGGFILQGSLFSLEEPCLPLQEASQEVESVSSPYLGVKVARSPQGGLWRQHPVVPPSLGSPRVSQVLLEVAP